MGDARGHWDGDTLVVETTTIKGSFQLTSAAGPALRIVERFKPVPGGALEWSVTIDDPSALDASLDVLDAAGQGRTTARARSNTPVTRATTRCATC